MIVVLHEIFQRMYHVLRSVTRIHVSPNCSQSGGLFPRQVTRLKTPVYLFFLDFGTFQGGTPNMYLCRRVIKNRNLEFSEEQMKR